MLALTLIGIAVALYVAKGNYTGQPLWCPIIDGCNAVVNSPYSRVFGVPMSYFGFIYYLYMFALAARLAFDPFSNSLRFRAVPQPRPTADIGRTEIPQRRSLLSADRPPEPCERLD
jgi:hypothetical protein